MSDGQTLKQSNAPDADDESSTGQKPKSYYYDDSTGYETYDGEADNVDGDDSEGAHQTES